MDLSEYQRFAKESVVFEEAIDKLSVDDLRKLLKLAYCALGLTGEAGEVADKVKKIIRDYSGQLTPQNIEALKAELGDVCWYNVMTAELLGIDGNEILKYNINKLESRRARGKLHGSGDNR